MGGCGSVVMAEERECKYHGRCEDQSRGKGND